MRTPPTHAAADPLPVDLDGLARLVGDGTPVLVDLWADWCGPCHAQRPAIDEIAAKRAGQLRVATIDVDAHPSAAVTLGVRGIPTLVLFDASGDEVWRGTGVHSAADLDAIVSRVTA